MYLYGMVLVLDLCFAYVLGWDGPHRVTQQKSNIPLFASIRFARDSGKPI
jgi:hypothetical protein